MDIEVKRCWFTDKSTVSQVTVDGVAICKILEDRDRGLDKTMALSEITKQKVYGTTAIPVGKYEVVISYSNRFGKLLPLLNEVPGFEGIRLHPGNTEVDSLGCLLPGKSRGTDAVYESKLAFADLYARIQKALKKEKVYINITRDGKAWDTYQKKN